MKKDSTTKGLLEHGDVFADIANVNLFGGRPVLRPVITCILYFGKKPWNNPLSLLDMLNIPEEEQDFWKEMVGDY